MNKIRVCIEAMLPAISNSEDRTPVGLEMVFGETEQAVDYAKIAELFEEVGKNDIIKLFCLEAICQPEDIRIITPEEYDEEYGAAKEVSQ